MKCAVEFIVFSADADFTPVLRKLRRHDRRTTVLAIGFPSAAYQASADLLIDERLFVREALGLGPLHAKKSVNLMTVAHLLAREVRQHYGRLREITRGTGAGWQTRPNAPRSP